MTKKKGGIVKLDGKPFNKEEKKPGLMLGRPIAREPMRENQLKFQKAFFELANQGYGMNWQDMEGIEWWMKHHSSARNAICRAFLEREDCDYLIFIDDDMTFIDLAEDIKKMIAHDKDVVMAICCCKPIPHFPHVGKFTKLGESGTIYDCEHRHVYTFPEDRIFESDGGSASLLCVKRKVIEKLPRPWFYFPPNYTTGNVWGEDITFMFNVKMWGFEIWADPTIQVGHLGMTAWHYKHHPTHYSDFKEGLIKESRDHGIEPDHHLIPEVQEIFKKGLGPKKMFV